ncbi:1231_t:CDS:2 [Ambispora leptoticha]|uniref:1231_t:CDS:1 n=1 Tax=Ambispora leptoticha TaxID=144679 RepID=A0A9N9BJM3_9GLOM|nr:1231_t:CDS:2 [Ambispora leptoticha]
MSDKAEKKRKLEELDAKRKAQATVEEEGAGGLSKYEEDIILSKLFRTKQKRDRALKKLMQGRDTGTNTKVKSASTTSARISKRNVPSATSKKSKSRKDESDDNSEDFVVEDHGEASSDDQAESEEQDFSDRPSKKKKRNSDSDEYSDGDNDLQEELQALDTSLIIKSGRRTRGKKIDYKQFGPDPVDLDDDE